LAAVLGYADRKQRLVSYCTGLLPGARKSVEPMACSGVHDEDLNDPLPF
jgi:SRSO17 transposase